MISHQHDPEVTEDQVRDTLVEEIKKIVPSKYLDENTKYIINPSGHFVQGGPWADAGLTGRKIIVDTYGGHAPHGGGAFSGKDPSKVDRSAAYAARWIAKSLVNAKLCRRVKVQISYGIGIAKPLQIYVNSEDTCAEGWDDVKLLKVIEKNFDLRPWSIITSLDLLKTK